jgi:hypothetical protein
MLFLNTLSIPCAGTPIAMISSVMYLHRSEWHFMAASMHRPGLGGGCARKIQVETVGDIAFLFLTHSMSQAGHV